MLDEIFESCERSTGDLAGVFEWDGEVGYFYLYAPDDGASKIKGAIKVITGQPDFDAEDVAIRWDSKEAGVGLFIRGVLWAAFIVTEAGGVHEQAGGNYGSGVAPDIPKHIRERLG